MAVAALLPVVHHLQVSHQQTTFSAPGFAHTLLQTVVAGAEMSGAVVDAGARRDSSHRVQDLTSPFVPAACKAWHGSQNHPGDVLCPALSPTSTGIL